MRSCASTSHEERSRRILNKQGTYKQENSTTVSRVDGHPPKPLLSLHDRMLLRKYPDAGTKTILSHSSTMVSSPPVAHPGGSVKQEKKVLRTPTKPIQERSRGTRNVQITKALPVDFCPRLKSLLFILDASLLHRFWFPSQFDFTLLYYTLVMDNAVPWAIYRISEAWKRQHVEL